MTNEEAIRIAQGLITDFKTESETMVDFCNTVIRALRQQNLPSVTPSYNSIKTELKPCKDCISRKVATDSILCDVKRNLCDSCIKNGCIFQSGIVRSYCDFYKSESWDDCSDLCTRAADVPDTNVGDLISRKAAIDAFHFWFRDGFDEDKWWNSTHVLAAIEGLPSVHSEHKWETCFECPLSHGCPKVKGCTNEQAIEYASQIPNDCPLYAQPEKRTEKRTETHACDYISRNAAIDAVETIGFDFSDSDLSEVELEEVCEAIGEVRQTWSQRIKRLPPVEPERKPGKWIDGKCNKCGANAPFWPMATTYYCSEYCPKCGAKMEVDG